MSPLVVPCPKTSEPIVTEIDTSPEGLAQVWGTTMLVRCPYCHEEHPIKVREAFLQSEISEMALGRSPIAKVGR
jgi:hypothetical protein